MTEAVVQRLPWDATGHDPSPFARALQERQGAGLDFLPAPPATQEAWAAHLQGVAAERSGCGEDVLAALRATHATLDPDEATRRSLDLLAGDEPVLAVVTGQQPGLFGGPLLTAHKIAGAVHLARQLDGVGGVRVVPVYWAATEDHDLDEANTATVLDRDGAPRVLRADAQSDGVSIGHRTLAPETLDAVFAALAAAWPDTERARAALDLCRRDPDDDFAHWSMRCVARLFAGTGLVIADPLTFAQAAAPTYDLLLAKARTIDDAVRASADALAAAGLPAPLQYEHAGTAPVFVREHARGPRLRVHVQAPEAGGPSTVTLRDAPAGTLDALRARVQAAPELASGNVVGRVFVQNALLPVVAYMAGPSEIAYQAQVRAAHQALALPFPLALPRPHATWLDRKTTRRAQAFGVSLADLVHGQAVQPEATSAADVLRGVEAHLAGPWPEAVMRALDGAGAGSQALAKALERLRTTWARSADRIQAAFEAEDGRGRAQWARMGDLARPRNRPQDRVLSPFSFVARHGIDAVRAGLAKLDPLQAGHYLVFPEGAPDV